MSCDIFASHLAQVLMQCMHLCVPEDQLFPHAVMMILQQYIPQPVQKTKDTKFRHVIKEKQAEAIWSAQKDEAKEYGWKWGIVIVTIMALQQHIYSLHLLCYELLYG